jgi:hypothetical protein
MPSTAKTTEALSLGLLKDALDLLAVHRGEVKPAAALLGLLVQFTVNDDAEKVVFKAAFDVIMDTARKFVANEKASVAAISLLKNLACNSKGEMKWVEETSEKRVSVRMMC